MDEALLVERMCMVAIYGLHLRCQNCTKAFGGDSVLAALTEFGVQGISVDGKGHENIDGEGLKELDTRLSAISKV